jgi:hypothetical protein
MRDLLEQGDGGHVERIAHRCLKGADAPLAKNYIWVAVIQDQSLFQLKDEPEGSEG